ncbi:MAG TPA: universal stress protein [Vineibacter sp.]|nr:universal stress protein [Vineibacter sp.]
MTLRTLLVHADIDDRFPHRLSLAVVIARAHKARVRVLYPLKAPVSIGLYSEPMGAPALELVQQEIDAERARGEALRNAIEQKMGAEHPNWDWRSANGLAGEVIAAAGATADLIVMGQERDAATAAPVGQVVLSSGRPVLCVPHTGTFNDCGRRVLVAWRGTRESARALHDALPVLERADRVILFVATDSDGDNMGADDAMQNLADHGIKAELRQTTLGDLDAGAAILNAVSDSSADLLVMGAYGHSRVREFVFGGATRTVLRSMTVPTLISH